MTRYIVTVSSSVEIDAYDETEAMRILATIEQEMASIGTTRVRVVHVESADITDA